ncbi:uncharacterized protein LOC131166019 isoform X2 [Malania oleifera]|uniref:uncharacterized protein LOC131166019 isoform X2 n=1 Tax=Malania oleifera TaxID=397392 RepID=UPI0025ADB391|nr:uncharacterized protein LOC131166019 isoform X2 [Malania oleifera]
MMGAGRKTQTYPLKEKSDTNWTMNCSGTARNLRKSDLAGVIFGCKHNTIEECYSKLLFGLPAAHFAYVRNIDPGLPLFLFNYSDRKLHGIFEAISCGQMNINPGAWTVDGSEYTPYAAQVRVKIKMACQPLLEDQFRPIIAKNYYEQRLFWFELDKAQISRLIALFSSSLDQKMMMRSRPIPISHNQVEDKTERLDFEVDVSCSYHTNMERTASRHSSGLGREYRSLQPSVNGEAVKTREQEVGSQHPNFARSYSSVVRDTGSDLPQKKWSALFKLPTSDMKQDEDSNRPVLEVNFPYSSLPNVEWDSLCSAAPSLDGENHPSETPAEEKGMEKYGEIGSWELNCDDASTHVVTELTTSFPASSSPVSFPSTDTSQDVEEFKTVVSGVNLPHSDEFDMALSSSFVAPFLEGRRQPSQTSMDDSTTDISKEELLPLTSGCFNSSTILKDTNLDNHVEDHAPFLTELHREDICSETVVPEVMKPSDLHLQLTKLVKITEELKASQLAQTQKISSLEQELVELRREIQQLKDQRLKKFSSSVHVEGRECELVVEASANLHESILIVGGFDGFSWLSDLNSYSPSLDLMKSLRPMNFVRTYASAAKLNGELYIFGGVDGDLWYDTVESYNPMSNQWSSCPPLNQKKASLAGISLNSKIFAIGGGNGVECFSDVEMLDPNVGSWIFAPSMFHKRFAPAAAEINGILYVVGGYDGKDYLKSVERFDPREHSWTRIASMSTRRGCHSLAVLNNKLYALGGFNGARMVPTVEALDPRFGAWMTQESMNDSRGYSGAVTIGDSIYVIGGMEVNDEILDTVESYKENQGWQVTNLKAVGKRCFFSAIVL